MKLRLATYNIHKGFSHFNRRMMVHELRHHLRLLDVDLVFLQEVQGEHEQHARNVLNWPVEPQYEFLADDVWQDYAYGRNAIYDHGHHGNAILSRFPIISAENQGPATASNNAVCCIAKSRSAHQACTACACTLACMSAGAGASCRR
jgi:endonuclease/exonuclease/phosphatase family metal-dependent hydrolase